MTFNPVKRSPLQAVTCEVLPIRGLAYLTDEENRTWTLTRQAAGSFFDELQPGTSSHLTLEHYSQFTFVGRCAPVSPSGDWREHRRVLDLPWC